MLDGLRKLMIALDARAGAAAIGRDARRLLLGALRAKSDLGARLSEIQAMADAMAAETVTWATPDDLASGKGGRFDSCDLRHWLAIAARAGVAAIPATTILELTEEQMSAASGGIQIPERYRGKLAAAAKRYLGDVEPAEPPAPPDIARVRESLAAAMDSVPEGWMVRHVRAASGSLKAIAGAGAAGPQTPETRFGPDLEVGPGWIRHGNRRSVDAADRRIVECYAQGPDGPSVFVARPWIQAGRFLTGEDPHRAGSRFAGPGIWPAEWRAFVFNGRVTGVAAYYGWAGELSPVAAANALKVRELAELVVGEAARQQAYPLYPALEILRLREPAHPKLANILATFTRDRIDCTIDFLETADGPMMLEAGPAHYPAPIGGGHPCSFAGARKIDGVAFRCLDGVLLADPATWKEPEDVSNALLSWEAAEELASQLTPAPSL